MVPSRPRLNYPLIGIQGGVGMQIPEAFAFPALAGYVGHPHFWERTLSRRQFLGATAAAGGVALTSPLWAPVLADATQLVDPRPIPQTVAPGAPFHIQLLGSNAEPSTITDFRGAVGGADLLGTGVGTDTTTGQETHLFTAIDNRFMVGNFIGVDGKQHHGVFAFV
jgi:hypothetical protein